MATLNEDDRALVARLLAGDQAAFDRFFDTHAAGLYRFALTRLNRDADAAEEVVQATLALALRKLGTYRGEAALFTWLCTFCRHEISAHVRRLKRSAPETPLIEDAPEVRAALESLFADSERPDRQLERREMAALVRVTLDVLPSHYGDALEWKYIHGLSVQDIAQRLGVSAKAAESLLTRARDAFRDAFSTIHDGAEGRLA